MDMAFRQISRRTRCGAVLFVLLTAALHVGCNKQIFSFRDPLSAAERRVDRALAESLRAAELQSEVTTQLRYNPAPCEGPDWEAWLYGSWVRGELRPEPARRAGTIEGRLRVTDERVEGANGWRYPVFALID